MVNRRPARTGAASCPVVGGGPASVPRSTLRPTLRPTLLPTRRPTRRPTPGPTPADGRRGRRGAAGRGRPRVSPHVSARASLGVVARRRAARGGAASGSADLRRGADAHGSGSSVPPPAEGWFRTLPAGAWSSLPDDWCVRRQDRPLPVGAAPGKPVAERPRPGPGSVRAAFAARPRSSEGAVDPRWDPACCHASRVSTSGRPPDHPMGGVQVGSVEQPAAATRVRESNWWQGEVYSSGRCVEQNGCGDVLTESTLATRQFCDGLASTGRLPTLYGVGRCPRTFSLVGVMSWPARTGAPCRATRTARSPSTGTPRRSPSTTWARS